MDIKHIRDIREDNDMTQAQIAKILNISQRAYSYYETGQHNIPLNILCQLADYYKGSTDYLLGRTNIKSTN